MVGDLFERLKATKRLPSPPGVAVRVLGLAQDADASLGEIAQVISSDPALAAKILKFVNSPLAGTSGNVTSVNQAIGLIGLRAVKLMALSFSLVSTGQKGACAGFSFDGFWSVSLACAVAGRTIAQHSKVAATDDAFITGLLSRIGQLGLVSTVPKQYAPVLREAQKSSDPLWEIERRVTGATHMEIGQRLLEHWRLPEVICRSVGGFRDVAPTGAPPPAEPLMKVLYLADQVAAVMCGPDTERNRAAALVIQAAEKLFGWPAQRWDEIFDEITDRWKEYGNILSIETPDVERFAEIQAEAQECIAELSLATQLEAQQVVVELDVALKRANSDALTGLANRAAFDERLEHEVRRAVRKGHPLALAMIDVDRFKELNDAHGHQAGDAVLRTVARALAGAVRDVDLVARYGGEEFAVIAPECDPTGAVLLGERLRQAVEATEVIYEGQSLKVTASLGVVVYIKPDGTRCPADLIRAADRLLYRAKDAGRNRAQCAVLRPVEASAPAADPT